MMIDRDGCILNYDTTDKKAYTLDDEITEVLGFKDTRWFKVKWRGY